MDELEAQYRYYERVIRLHEISCGIEVRGNGKNFIKGEKGRFVGSKPAGGSGKIVSKALTNKPKSVRLDMNGKPFDYPTVLLPKAEYARVMHEINTYWHKKFQGKALCHIGLGKTYFFENRGFNDYNIYDVTED